MILRITDLAMIAVTIMALLVGKVEAMNFGSNNRCQYAISGISTDGEFFCWGEPDMARGFYQIKISNVETFVSSEMAYLFVHYDGTVTALGLPSSGGVLPHDADSTINLHGVSQAVSSSNAFAVLLNDGTVRSFGGSNGGTLSATEQSQLTRVKFLRSNSKGFAAIKEDGTAFTWGGYPFPASYRGNLTNVKDVYSSDAAFIVVTHDGRVVSYGSKPDDIVPAHVAPFLVDVDRVYTNDNAFAAVTKNGSVVTWGCCKDNHKTTCLTQDEEGLFNGRYKRQDHCESYVFGAYMTDEEKAMVNGGVVSISTTSAAMAALKLDGTVFAWGNPMFGGDVTVDLKYELRDINTVFASKGAFAALRADTTLVVWGFGLMGGMVPDSVLGSSPFLTNVVSVDGNSNGFSVMKSDGKVVAWGGVLSGTKIEPVQFDKGKTENIVNATTTVATLQAFGYMDGTSLGVSAIGYYLFGGEINDESSNRIRDMSGTPEILIASTLFYADSTVAGAIPCPAGRYGLKGWPACEYCPSPQPPYTVKSYVSGVRTTIGSCISCPAGQFSVDGVTCVSDCPPGYTVTLPTFYDSSSEICRKCREGDYYNETSGVCLSCPAGKYAYKVTGMDVANECLICPRGKFSGGGSQDCESCPARYNTRPVTGLETGFTSVDDCYSRCPAGEYGVHRGFNGNAICRTCNEGTYSPESLAVEEGAFECLPCAPGTYTSSKGSTECTPCPAGKFSQFNFSTECGDCPQGTYAFMDGMSSCSMCDENEGTLGTGASMCVNKASIPPYKCNPGSGKQSMGVGEGKQVCMACAPGKYSEDGEKCIDCPAGRYSTDTGAKVCKLCGPGTYGDEEGRNSNANACKVCPKSEYNSFAGATSCSACPPGSYCGEHGLDKPRECERGSYSSYKGSDVCQFCERGKYQASEGEALCSDCPAGRYGAINGSVSDAACLVCQPGTFSDYAGATSCSRCGKTEYTPVPESLACMECSGAGQIGNAERTGCMTDPAFTSLGTSASLIEYMYVKGFAWLGALLITLSFVGIVVALQYKKEQHVLRNVGASYTPSNNPNGKQPDDGSTIALMGRFQVLAKTVMPSYSFGTEIFVIIGFTVEAPDLAAVMIVFRLLHTAVAGLIISALFRHSEAVWLEERGIIHKAASLHSLMEGPFVRDNQPLIGALALVCLCDTTFLQFFPWRNTEVFEASKGFPASDIMRWCLSVEVLQSLVAVTCQGVFIDRVNDNTVSAPALALIGSNMAISILGAIMGLLLLCLKDGVVQRMSMTPREKQQQEQQEQQEIEGKKDSGEEGPPITASSGEHGSVEGAGEEDKEDDKEKDGDEAHSKERADITTIYRRKSEDALRFTTNPMLATGANMNMNMNMNSPVSDYVPSPSAGAIYVGGHGAGSTREGGDGDGDGDGDGRTRKLDTGNDEMLAVIQNLREENAELRRRAEQYREQAERAIDARGGQPERQMRGGGADNL